MWPLSFLAFIGVGRLLFTDILTQRVTVVLLQALPLMLNLLKIGL